MMLKCVESFTEGQVIINIETTEIMNRAPSLARCDCMAQALSVVLALYLAIDNSKIHILFI